MYFYSNSNEWTTNNNKEETKQRPLFSLIFLRTQTKVNQMADNHKPLRKISEAFRELEATVNSQTPDDVEVASFSRACSLISPLFGCLGIAFKFAEMDYVAKVKLLGFE